MWYLAIAIVSGNWRPIHRIFEWNKPVDEGKAKVVYGIDIVPFSGPTGHTCRIEGNCTLEITANYPDAFGKPKAVHDKMAEDVFTNIVTNPNAKATYNNLLVCSVAATQQMTHDRNEQKFEYGKAVFKVHFAKAVDKKGVTMKEVPHQDASGKWMKILVVDVPQTVDNEFVATLEIASGSPLQAAAVAHHTGETDKEH